MKLAPLIKETIDRGPSDDWDQDCNRFIGFIDIMGFKDLVARQRHRDIKHMLLQMNQTRTILLKIIGKPKKTDKNKRDSRVRSVSFSDSIVFITKSDTEEDLANLSLALSICQEATLQSGLPTKGAVSHGFLTADFQRSIFFGQPLIDAYLLQEELLYYDVVLDNKVESILKTMVHKKTSQFATDKFILLPTPFKGAKVNHYNISLDSVTDDQLDYLYDSVSGTVRKYVDNTIEMYRAMQQGRKK